MRNDESLSTPWDGASDDPALESEMLSALAYYIGERIAEELDTELKTISDAAWSNTHRFYALDRN